MDNAPLSVTYEPTGPASVRERIRFEPVRLFGYVSALLVAIQALCQFLFEWTPEVNALVGGVLAAAVALVTEVVRQFTWPDVKLSGDGGEPGPADG